MKIRSCIALWLGIALLVLPFSLWLAHSSARGALQDQLIQQLPSRLLSYSVNSYELGANTPFLLANINRDLSQIPTHGLLRILSSCRAQIDTLEIDPEDAMDSNSRQLQWHTGANLYHANFQLTCNTNWTIAIALALLSASIPAALLRLLPPALNRAQRQTLMDLRQLGVSERVSRAEINQVQALGEEPLAFLPFALQHFPELSQSLALVRQPISLQFDLANSGIYLRGIRIEMPHTPLMYYYWYASLRVGQSNEGWVNNPSAIRPDLQSAQQLIELLTSNDGNAKAIRDLRDKGLRARTLDQNRSKIKDELVGRLGETLAAFYLFDMRRDPKTARYAYRLSLDPSFVHL